MILKRDASPELKIPSPGKRTQMAVVIKKARDEGRYYPNKIYNSHMQSACK